MVASDYQFSILRLFLLQEVVGNKRIVVVVDHMDLQLLVQSVLITTEIVSLNQADDEVQSIQHYVTWLSITCNKSVVVSGHYGFFHHENWPPLYCLSIVESVVKYHNPNPEGNQKP